MATRMYFASTGSAPVTPTAYDASWASTSGVTVRPFRTTNGGTTLTDFDTLNYTNDLTDKLVFQFVSPPIDAATLTGTFKMIIRSSGNPTGSWMVGHCVLKVVNNAGTSVVGTVVSSATMGASARFAVTNATSKTIRYPDGGGTAACTSTSISSGDRLVLEVGFENQNTATDDCRFRIGESGGSDFAYTQNLTTDLNPWCELSQTLTFQAEGGGGGSTGTNQLMLMGVGT